MMINSSEVVIVIVNWNRKDDILRCISSVRSSDFEHFQILIIDNASTDGSVEAIRAAYPEEVKIIIAEKNIGFTGGNNIGIRWAVDHRFDWVLLLNNDVIIAPDSIGRMIETGQRDPTIGIVGPMVYHADEPKVIQSAGGLIDKYWNTNHRGLNEIDQGQYSQNANVPWVTGCALLARVDMIVQIGLLDERFFAYGEEVDWCLRARQSGWKIRFVPAAHVWHSGVSRAYSPEPYITYYMTRNHLLLLAKNQVSALVWIYSLFQTIRTLVSWTIKPKWRNKAKHRLAIWQGLMDFLQRRWGSMQP